MKTFILCAKQHYDLIENNFEQFLEADDELLKPYQFGQGIDEQIQNRAIRITERLEDIPYEKVLEAMKMKWLEQKLAYSKKQIKHAEKIVLLTGTYIDENEDLWELQQEYSHIRNKKKGVIQIANIDDLNYQLKKKR